MSKHCQCRGHKWRKKFRKICSVILIVIFILLLIFLITWAILQPRKPTFTLQDATIFNYNVSASNLLSSNLQVTIWSRNPNAKIGIYYEGLRVHATYHSQQITYFQKIPDYYQGHKDSDVWSPFIYGIDVPIAPYNGPYLLSDQQTGSVEMSIKIDGRVKWKVGAVTTARYHLHVKCLARVQFENNNNNGLYCCATAIKFTLQQGCSVSL